MCHVTFADSYLRANIEFKNKACTRGKYYLYTSLYFMLSVFIYVYRHIYVRHVLAVALASLGLRAWTCSCESVRLRLRVRQTLTGSIEYSS